MSSTRSEIDHEHRDSPVVGGLMFLCPVCLGDMRPLFTGFFCPNDCDRPPDQRSRDATDYAAQYKAMLRISMKVLSQDRESFLEGCRGRSAPWFAYQVRGSWRSAGKMKIEDTYRASVILEVRADGSIRVLKNSDGSHEFDQIPDQP